MYDSIQNTKVIEFAGESKLHRIYQIAIYTPIELLTTVTSVN